MNFKENSVYHIYNRGNNQQRIFFDDENYQFFMKKIKIALYQHCELLNYCLMPNHFHLMVHVNQEKVKDIYGREKLLNDKIGVLLRSYTRALQIERNFKGSLFQQHTKAKEIIGYDEFEMCESIKTCAQYIHQNPLKAGLVKDLEDWPYSSYHDYNGKIGSLACNKKLFYELAKTENINFILNNHREI